MPASDPFRESLAALMQQWERSLQQMTDPQDASEVEHRQEELLRLSAEMISLAKQLVEMSKRAMLAAQNMKQPPDGSKGQEAGSQE